jgi:hypothetical protein
LDRNRAIGTAANTRAIFGRSYAHRNDPQRVFDASRLDDGSDGGVYAAEEVQRLPIDLGRLPDGLRRELRSRDVDKYVGIQRLHLDDVRVDAVAVSLFSRRAAQISRLRALQRPKQPTEGYLLIILEHLVTKNQDGMAIERGNNLEKCIFGIDSQIISPN